MSDAAYLGVTRLVAPALALIRIRKSFGAFQALDGADFGVQRGEVHALLGENGAGKSSLMNVAAGLYTPDSGRIEVDGVEVALSGPRAARVHRIGMVHQHFKLVKRFTVAENILLASSVRRAFKSDLRKIEKEIARQAEDLEFSVEPRRRIDTLSVAEQQQVEILKVLIGGAEILILDEPTAVLTDQESHRLLTTVRELAANGSAVVFVTHKLAEVRDFADRVTVMRSGRTVATADARATPAREMTKLVIGTDVTQPSRLANANIGEARLYVADLRCAREDGHVSLDGASFVVNAGEIYGIAGVSGNGQTELAEALMGVRTALAGSIEVAGEGNLTATPPQRRRAAGICTIPADRYAYGLAGDLSVVENFTIGQVRTGRFGSWFRVDASALRVEAAKAIQEFDVQGVRSLKQKSALLSGGNAQKLVLARELSEVPRVIVAHSPSRGLDVRACAAVHERLLGARDAGAAVLLVSDDLDEVLSLSDRIGVMARGRIVAEFKAPADRQQVGNAMVNHA
jgi:general nucleoside transport system ATP-binding protein